jgi:PAS domain S-box-containing protein
MAVEHERVRGQIVAATVGAQELSAMVELAREPIFARDASRRITFWNRGAADMYGYSRAEALGARPHELLRTEYPLALEEIERAVADTGTWDGQLIQYTRAGRRMVVASTWTAQYDEDGGLAALLELNRDITVELARQAAVLELAPDAFVGVGRDGLIVLANQQAEALFGYDRGELLGRPVEMLVPERYRDAHAANRAGYLADPRMRPMGAGLELFALRADGREFPAEISLSSMQTDDGPLALAAVRDTSERVAASAERERLRAEAEREKLRSRVQQAQRLESLGLLAGGIAHDFNNLLAVIINYAGFVAGELDAAAGVDGDERWRRSREDVEQIRVAGERAAQLTRQLLAFARREVAQPDVIDVNRVVEDVEHLLRRTLGEHIELRSTLADGLRAVLIDPGQLEQILVNLAVNARDAMPEGGMLSIDTANVEVDAQYAASHAELAVGAHVRVRVSDTGEGMAPEVLEKAFDPFFTTKAPGEGTGLGLATVYGIVKQAGGYAQIYSEQGVGTTFTVLLPATERRGADAELAVQAERAVRGETVLLVEDEPALREVTRRMLAAGGYRVLTAANGPEALALADVHGEEIDLLLTDVIMPQMPGPQLAERMRERRASLRVLFMSGFAQPILDSSELLLDGVALIEKPFSGPALFAKIAEVLAR